MLRSCITAILFFSATHAEAQQCFLPKSPTEPRCYTAVGPPLGVMTQQLGNAKWSGLMPDGSGVLFMHLYENAECWHLTEWRVGSKEYCITRGGLSDEGLRAAAERKQRGK